MVGKKECIRAQAAQPAISDSLPARPPPQEAVFNVYELKTQPELVRYLHASAGFPTKPTWLRAVRNRQYASWPGLTP
jgi:hypothetical protein